MRINPLSLALLHLFGAPLPEVFRDALLRPRGASEDWSWRGCDDAWVALPGRRVQSVPGGSHGGGGVSIGARDQARLGQLLLHGGHHQGVQLVAQVWVRFMFEPCAIAPFDGGLPWLNRDGRSFAGTSSASACMAGAGGHLTWVEPAHDAVAVRRWMDPAATAGFAQRMAAGLQAMA